MVRSWLMQLPDELAAQVLERLANDGRYSDPNSLMLALLRAYVGDTRTDDERIVEIMDEIVRGWMT